MKRLILAAALALGACNPAATDATTDATISYNLVPADLPAFFDCLRERSYTVIGAHRGGPAPGFAENAIPTFENTLRQAPALLEIDISETRDGHLVLMHDEQLDRTTTGEGPVDQITLADFQALQLQDNDGQTLDAHPPTFREALDWAEGRAILQIDVKRGVAYEDVIAEIRAAGAQDRVVFITYSIAAAIRVHRLAPELMLSVSIDSEDDLAELERAGVDLTRVLAWTGIEEPNPALNVALIERGVEPMFGTLGNPATSWDGRFAREGDDKYAEFAETGLALIATDRPVEAARDLDAADGVEGHAALRCATLQSPTGRYDQWTSEN
jgi:glycerophosphoryl diester phosphodiesterase